MKISAFFFALGLVSLCVLQLATAQSHVKGGLAVQPSTFPSFPSPVVTAAPTEHAEAAEGAATDVGATAAETTFPTTLPSTAFPTAVQYAKYPRQVLPIRYTQPSYTTLPPVFHRIQIPPAQPQVTTKTAPSITQPTQYSRNQPIQAPALYGKAH